jgi:hypothetical protein
VHYPTIVFFRLVASCGYPRLITMILSRSSTSILQFVALSGQLLCEFEMSDFTCFLLALNTFHIFLQLVLQYFDPKFILLFVSIQDLAVVVLLILIPLISPNSSKGGVRFSRHSLVKYLFLIGRQYCCLEV